MWAPVLIASTRNATLAAYDHCQFITSMSINYVLFIVGYTG